MNAPALSSLLLVHQLGLHVLHKASHRVPDTPGSTLDQPLPLVERDGIWLVPLGEKAKNTVFCSQKAEVQSQVVPL